jgi:hypothetical protein
MWTALMAASFWGQKNVVEVLVAMGADVNLADRDGETALSEFSERHYLGTICTVARGSAQNF